MCMDSYFLFHWYGPPSRDSKVKAVVHSEMTVTSLPQSDVCFPAVRVDNRSRCNVSIEK